MNLKFSSSLSNALLSIAPLILLWGCAPRNLEVLGDFPVDPEIHAIGGYLLVTSGPAANLRLYYFKSGKIVRKINVDFPPNVQHTMVQTLSGPYKEAIAVTTDEGDLFTGKIESQGNIKLALKCRGIGNAMSLAPDGQSIAFVRSKKKVFLPDREAMVGDLIVRNLDTGVEKIVWRRIVDDQVSWSPTSPNQFAVSLYTGNDLEYLFASGHDSRVAIVDCSTGKKTVISKGTDSLFSCDGGSVLFVDHFTSDGIVYGLYRLASRSIVRKGAPADPVAVLPNDITISQGFG